MTHGANIYKYAKKIGSKADEIIDFSSNINLYQPDIDLNITPSLIAKYPDSKYKDLKKIIASNYKIKSSQIALFNGATSAIYELFASLLEKKVYLYAPLYSEYEKAALKSKKDIYKIDRLENIFGEVDKKSIVVFVNPATPEGKYYNLDKLIQKWIDLKCVIVLDESFLEFEELKSYRDFINKYKKLYVIQSFSKFYSSAGVRVGAIFSNKKNIKKLTTPLWNLSSLDVEFLKKRLIDEDFKRYSKELHIIQKERLLEILKNSELFEKIVPSNSNFILTYSKDADFIFKHLLKNRILVRVCDSFDYLDKNWLRFAVKDKKSQDSLENTLLGIKNALKLLKL